MILTRSPYYYNVDFPNDFVESVDFTLDVGVGSLSSITSQQTYNFTKRKPSDTSTNTWLDISPFIRDLFAYSPISVSSYPSPEVISGGETLLAAITAQPVDSLGSTIDPSSNKYICTDGYGYYPEGQNFEATKKILLSHNDYRAHENGYFIVPLRCASSDADPTVDGVPVALNFTDTNSNYVKYLVIPLGGYTGNITVVFESETLFIELIEECKYPINEVQFINRYGVLELIHFYKSARESLSIKSEDFKNAYTNGTSFDVSRHQIKQYNKISNKGVRIETGFLTPSYNETIQELLQSEHVWIDGKPMNVDTNSLELKSRIVDKLISYSIEFNYAFDEINNV